MENIKIAIVENGTTTLATSGKYCDRNIDVEVNVPTSGGELPELEYTGNISGYFSPNTSNMSSNNTDQAPICQLITILGDRIKFNRIESLSKAFQYNQIRHLPSYEFNLVDGAIFGVSPLAIFQNCYNLEELDVRFKGVLAKGMQMFASCNRLRTISDNVFKDATIMSDWTGTNFNAIFQNCYSLKKVPKYFFDIIPRTSSTTGSYHFYNNLFNSCYSLDEVKDLPVILTMPSGCLNYTFSYCCRIKEITFETNEDGTPMDAGTTTSVLLDLTNQVGYGMNVSMATLNTNSGLSEDKFVYDDITYQALKNDPDWFTADINYSRYNHDSAVNTINSLPDCSSGSGNTINFKGQAGASTDGGAINTLTEEEIAVAAAKGWTVSLS